MVNIVVKNLRNEKPSQPWQIRVDRSSPLGNPFYMENESKRDEVCDKYEQFFNSVVYGHDDDDHTKRFKEELEYLLDTYRIFGKLELFCWCAPKRCHADTIKSFMISLLEKS